MVNWHNKFNVQFKVVQMIRKSIRSESKLNLNTDDLEEGKYSSSHINIHIQFIQLIKSIQQFHLMLSNIAAYSPPALIIQPLFKFSTLLQNTSKYLASLFFNSQSSKVDKFFFTLGLLSLTYSLGRHLYNNWKFWSWLPAYLKRRKPQNFASLKEKYGKCFVLITGAADGIGYAFARQWAKLGFDLILVDIQKDKLLFRTRQILETFKGIQVESFVVDMSNREQIKQFLKQIQKFEVGILINNVGLSGGGSYLQIPIQTIEKTLSVNYIPMYMLTSALLPKLRQRVNRSAIINLSSATGVYFSHNIGPYSSIKHAVDIYSRTLSIQNRDKIDVLSVRPFGVSAGMLKMRKQQRIITPKKCAQAVLSQLGGADQCFPSVQHKMMASFFESLNENQRLQVYGAAWDKNKKIKQ